MAIEWIESEEDTFNVEPEKAKFDFTMEIPGEGIEMQVKRYDPFGFYRITWSKGRTPDSVATQQFTTLKHARVFCQKFLDNLAEFKEAQEEAEAKKAKIKSPSETKKTATRYANAKEEEVAEAKGV